MQLGFNAAFIEFEIPGKPVAWQRPVRFVGKDGQIHQHTADESRAYQNLVKLACREKMNGTPIIDGPIKLDVSVVVEIPASWSQRKQAEARAGERLPTGRPDLDNIIKSIKDGLNGVAYRDDSQVCRESSSKEYGTAASVRVRLATLLAKGHK